MSAPRPLALVTGASAGIGAQLAAVLAERGHDLVLVARGVAKMEALAARLREAHGGSVTVVGCDLARPGAGAELEAELAARGLVVDVLVNNAGFGLRGRFAELDAARQVEMIQLNVTVLVDLTRRLLPGMLARKRGGVLNVASTAAFQAGPFMAVYYATRAFVLSFSDALTIEQEGTGVTVTCLCPGPTRTEFVDAAGMRDTKLFTLTAPMAAEDVARQGVDGFLAGTPTVIPGFTNQLGAWATALAPRRVAARVAAALQAPNE